MTNRIPLNDLRRLHRPIRADLDRAISRVMDSGRFLSGQEVTAFEEEWADFCGQRYCVACNSGTDALTIAGLALRWSEASVQANTLSLTAVGLHRASIKLRIVDVDPEGRVHEDAVNAVPVLLYGRLPGASELRHTLFDAAHAHGWRPPEHATACWSFYPTKTLGALGDSGAVTTNNADVAAAMRNLIGIDDRLRDGRQITSRMDEIQAAILRVKFRHLPSWIAERQDIGAWYKAELPPDAQMVSTAGNDLHHLAVVRATYRDQLMEFLNSQGIETKIHFPDPLHLQQAPWADLSLSLPNAERWCRSVLTLPCFPGMQKSELQHIVHAITKFYETIRHSNKQGIKVNL
jgi:dTDP-4-amino-4,6-dideoxygalactose transaminase